MRTVIPLHGGVGSLMSSPREQEVLKKTQYASFSDEYLSCSSAMYFFLLFRGPELGILSVDIRRNKVVEYSFGHRI